MHSSWMELISAARDFETIASRWPHAVKTPRGIVIPRFHRVSPNIAIDAVIRPAVSVAFRPAIQGRARYDDARRRCVAAIEEGLGVSLESEPVPTADGTVTLHEEWGDFAVVIALHDSLSRARNSTA